MPLYEYRCDACGETFEVMQKFADPPVTRHEACGGSVRRLLSAPALQFKGTGWYVTDYGRNGGGKTGSASKESSKKDAGKSDSGSSSSGSTPAPKTEK